MTFLYLSRESAFHLKQIICIFFVSIFIQVFLAGCSEEERPGACADIDCSGHGRCLLALGAGGTLRPTCRCDPGYLPEASGWLCLDGSDDSLCRGVTCSGHGRCLSSAGRATCSCDPGYQASSDGLACLDPCLGITCTGVGTCQLTGGAASCTCPSGYRTSLDGRACESLSLGSQATYLFTYDAYPTYPMGKGTLDLTLAESRQFEERSALSVGLDYGGLGLSRMSRQTLVVAPDGTRLQSYVFDDQLTQGKVTRRRRLTASFGASEVQLSAWRAEASFSLRLPYRGTRAPLPMPGAVEYPGWTFGCGSPIFYALALARYDRVTRGKQLLDVLYPESLAQDRIIMEADAAFTDAAPVLVFPSLRVRVTFDSQGPVKIELQESRMTWTRTASTPEDLNMAAAKTPTPLVETALPAGGVDHAVAITGDGGTLLEGTATLPSSPSGVPAVLMLPDPYGHDRDAPIPSLPRLALYRHLAAHLAKAGVASLRYDGRGRGASQGSLTQVTLAQLVGDGHAALNLLAKLPGVDASRLYLLSVGPSSLVALSLLHDPQGVRGYIGLSPVVGEVKEVVAYRAGAHVKAAGFSDKTVDSQKSAARNALLRMLRGESGSTSYGGLPLSYWKPALLFDGGSLLARFAGPVLLLRGAEDLETPAEQLLLASQSAPGKGNLTVKTLAGRTYALTTGKMSDLWESAAWPTELPSDTVQAIVAWLAIN